jgi:glycosyltransferase involved in cell wall biosynthesis
LRGKRSGLDFEVVVVVDGSSDDTVEMLGNFDAPFQLNTFWQENRGQSHARNQGVVRATGQYCLFIDDDIVASSQLVAEHLHAQRRFQNVVAIGQITLSLPATADWYANAFARSWRQHYDWLSREH